MEAAARFSEVKHLLKYHLEDEFKITTVYMQKARIGPQCGQMMKRHFIAISEKLLQYCTKFPIYVRAGFTIQREANGFETSIQIERKMVICCE